MKATLTISRGTPEEGVVIDLAHDKTIVGRKPFVPSLRWNGSITS